MRVRMKEIIDLIINTMTFSLTTKWKRFKIELIKLPTEIENNGGHIADSLLSLLNSRVFGRTRHALRENLPK